MNIITTSSKASLSGKKIIMFTLALWLIISCAPKSARTVKNIKTAPDTESTTNTKFQIFTAYYVGGKNASDSNTGTTDAPFATISKAAGLLKEGDTCYIRDGIYRETIVPKNSGSSGKPIVFTSDGGVDVTISGADNANGGWTVHSGNIYKKTIVLPVTGYNNTISGNKILLANQVFSGRKMMIEARWPNISNSDDLMNRADLRPVSTGAWIRNSAGTTIRDASIPDIPGGWTGGTIWTIGWFIPQTSTIASSMAGQINIPAMDEKFLLDKNLSIKRLHNYYYLTGRMGALDVEKEWFYDGTILYLWAPGGKVPTNVEVKMRNYAFDLSDKSYITISNINVFAATIITNKSSTNIILDRLKVQYISHFVTLENNLNSHSSESGILLMGANNIIKNSIVEFSAGHGIVLGDEGCAAENNLVHDISYGGTYCCGIMPAQGSVRQKITHNTIYRTGRSGIHGVFSNKDIGYNDIYDFGFINTDMAAIYAANKTSLKGTRIHHNWLHNAQTDIHHEFPVGAGIYLDQNAKHAQIDHNVFWNNHYNDLRLEQDSTPFNKVYNNTLASTPIDPWDAAFTTYHGRSSGNNKNNIYCSIIKPNTSEINEITSETNPLFVNAGYGGLAYRLQPGSPAIDHGEVVEGVTDGFQGKAPDAGAYEFSGQEWQAGVLSKPGPVGIIKKL